MMTDFEYVFGGSAVGLSQYNPRVSVIFGLIASSSSVMTKRSLPYRWQNRAMCLDSRKSHGLRQELEQSLVRR